MPSVPTISFTVKFDLTGVPSLKLTDTTTFPSGAKGIFNITQPDGYTRYGNFASPDITSGGQVFTFNLFLSSSGTAQNGEYNIEYVIQTTDLEESTFTRNFQFYYDAPTLIMNEEFDVFTPMLKYYDQTIYQVSNFNNGTVSRSWSAVSVPTGTITSTSSIFNVIYNLEYYDAYYAVTLSSTILYTHQVYSWLTVSENVTKTINTYAATPPSIQQFVVLISALKTVLDSKIDTVSDYASVEEDFQYAQTLFGHIMDKLKTFDLTNIDRDLKDLIAILHNYQIPTYTPTNLPIPPYDYGDYNAVAWGAITGDITSQTDLWDILQTLTIQTNYVHDQATASDTWVVTHNMGKKPSVSIVDTADDEVIGQVLYNSNNQLTISFSSAVAGKAYLN